MSALRGRAAQGWATWYRRALPAYWVFLFTSTHLPRLSFGEHAPRWSDKAAHVVGFGLLAFLLWRFCQTLDEAPGPWFAVRAFLLISAYAAVDEVLQLFVGRGADPGDWMCDAVGAGAVLLALEIGRRRATPPRHVV